MANFKDMFNDIEGPTDAELQALESEDFSPETIQGLQRMYAKIDPQYGRRLAERDRSRGIAPMSGASSRGRGESAATQDELVAGQGGVLGGNTNSTDFDPADTQPAIRATSVGNRGVSTSSVDPNSEAYKAGKMYLKIAGPTCNHPRCRMYRDRGLELMGLKQTHKITGRGRDWSESTTAPITSKSDPRWREIKGSYTPSDFFMPSEYLEHKHGPEDDDFEGVPLPF